MSLPKIPTCQSIQAAVRKMPAHLLLWPVQ
jgi:hypothetical protein